MRHGRHHDVTARIGIQVQDDERQDTAFDDQVIFVVRPRQGIAENAATMCIMAFDVFHPPG